MGLEDYLETHFEVVEELLYQLEDMEHPNLLEMYKQQGKGGLWVLAKSITDEFEELHKDRVWDGEWMGEIQKLVHNKIDKL